MAPEQIFEQEIKFDMGKQSNFIWGNEQKRAKWIIGSLIESEITRERGEGRKWKRQIRSLRPSGESAASWKENCSAETEPVNKTRIQNSESLKRERTQMISETHPFSTETRMTDTETFQGLRYSAMNSIFSKSCIVENVSLFNLKKT